MGVRSNGRHNRWLVTLRIADPAIRGLADSGAVRPARTAPFANPTIRRRPLDERDHWPLGEFVVILAQTRLPRLVLVLAHASVVGP